MQAVATAAEAQIASPILVHDVGISVAYSTLRGLPNRIDVDNLVKPTLDALKGIAYRDDNQVRSVRSEVFDRTRGNQVGGRVEHIGRLFYSKSENVVLIEIYSESRLTELGGQERVERQRLEEFQRSLPPSMRSVAPRSTE